VPPKNEGSTTTTLSYFHVRSSRLSQLPCQRCRTTLDILQPDLHRPFQFLATCPDCGAWYRVEIRAGDSRGVMLNLPEIARLGPILEEITTGSVR